MRTRPETILTYLADLAPEAKRTTDVVRRTSEFVYLGWQPYLMSPAYAHQQSVLPQSAVRNIPRPAGRDLPRKELRRLASIDALHSTERLLRLGWLFLAGTIDLEGRSTRFCKPLLSVPVALRTRGFEVHIQQLGDIEMPGDLFDERTRDELEESDAPYGGGADEPSDEVLARMPKLQSWVATAVQRAGLPPARLRSPNTDPLHLRNEEGLSVVSGAAIFTARDTAAPGVAGTLLGWASHDLGGTAFDALYGAPTTEPATSPGPIRSPLPLNARQHEALERSHRETITVVSGPPGTGKSHLVAAMAIDEVARGHSVLVATQSDYAAEVITDLLDRHPGPRYIRFGRREDRESAAGDLSDGLAVPLNDEEVSTLEIRAGEASATMERIRATIRTLIQREAAFADGLSRRDMLTFATAQAPGVLTEGVNLSAAERLLRKAETTTGLFARWRRTKADRKLRGLVGARADATLDELAMALDAGKAELATKRGLEGGGLSLETIWREYERAEAGWRESIGASIEAVRRSRTNSKRTSVRAVAALASALRAGRVQRRRILRDLSGDHFLDVLPLWVGTLKEIDDTLPLATGMFDVVMFDEASQIDQLRAAPALARARRAVIVGDPRQLRHVSFTADLAIEDTAARHGISGDLARILDVRRNSLFDAAAAESPIIWLDEHFRSVPHLIGFSDRRFYGGRLKLMTQHPATESRDAIHMVHTGGRRDRAGVNQAEVAAVRTEVERLAAAGATSIGIITPFRAQADALEHMLLEAFEPEDAERLGLRVGTVHAFQGNERDYMVASLAMTDGDLDTALRFVENPNLFNVMITRARTEMTIVHSFTADGLPAGLLKDYFRHGDHAPRPSESTVRPDGWAGDILDELRRFGVKAVAGYPVAGWTVDLAVGEGRQAFGVVCLVHPDGPEAHIERHMALRRAGWTITDAYQSRWLSRPESVAEELAKRMLA